MPHEEGDSHAVVERDIEEEGEDGEDREGPLGDLEAAPVGREVAVGGVGLD